jgi:hypothetical protein
LSYTQLGGGRVFAKRDSVTAEYNVVTLESGKAEREYLCRGISARFINPMTVARTFSSTSNCLNNEHRIFGLVVCKLGNSALDTEELGSEMRRSLLPATGRPVGVHWSEMVKAIGE